jgi:BirA family transcriptional regulator, biotin operon repressor / biotin---[acetyl-CoA-carboxylase] ligase
VNIAPAWPTGYALRHFETIDSTNEEARRLAAAGEPGPVWIAADRQSAGRGRRGRNWESPTGNLAASLFLRPARPAAECAQLSFVAAIAASDAIAPYAGDAAIRVKWPNDVLAGGKKIAGILLESASNGGERLDWLAVGIGINLAEHPEGTEFPATSLAALGTRPPAPREALVRLAVAWAKWYDVWAARGFGEIRDIWLSRAAGLGTRIRARLQNEETSGVFEGIDNAGALILREAQGRSRTIAAGEVFF